MREYFKILPGLGSVAPASALCILSGRVAAVTRAGVVDRSNEEDRMMRQPQADAPGRSVSTKAFVSCTERPRHKPTCIQSRETNKGRQEIVRTPPKHY